MNRSIALCRVSSKEQLDSNSLAIQGDSVNAMATELDAPIVKQWSINQSSKKGNNIKRKDLKDALALCKKDKTIKYFLVDKVNRLMREMEMLLYYKVCFRELGVKLIFCDSGQRDLNEDTPEASLKLAQKAYDAEVDNRERSETSLSRMSARVRDGFYPFNTHAGYKKTEAEDGLHIPDEPRFSLLKKGCHLIIYKQHTPSQAVRWMNENGYRTKGGKKLDMNHFEEFIEDEYYCGVVKIKRPGWPEPVDGLHVPLLSKREHSLLVSIIKKRNPRVRITHNPEFPLSGLIRHHECRGSGGYEKFVGHNRNPGKTRKGTQKPTQPVYDCRDCRKRISRDNAHRGMTAILEDLMFIPNASDFKKALLKVWKNQRGSNAQRIRVLEVNKDALERKIRDITVTYATETNEVIRGSLSKLLTEYDAELKNAELALHETTNLELESEEFVKFAFERVETMRAKWWKLSWDDKARGEQIIFNGKIYIDNSATVHPPDLSSIYRLGTNKKALSDMDNAHLVELAGTAPASAGLSWLIVYRHSLFYGLRLRVSKQTNIS